MRLALALDSTVVLFHLTDIHNTPGLAEDVEKYANRLVLLQLAFEYSYNWEKYKML